MINILVSLQEKVKIIQLIKTRITYSVTLFHRNKLTAN